MTCEQQIQYCKPQVLNIQTFDCALKFVQRSFRFSIEHKIPACCKQFNQHFLSRLLFFFSRLGEAQFPFAFPYHATWFPTQFLCCILSSIIYYCNLRETIDFISGVCVNSVIQLLVANNAVISARFRIDIQSHTVLHPLTAPFSCRLNNV